MPRIIIPSHRDSRSPEHRAWCAINARCYNPKNKMYFRYGGRGIGIAPEWRHDYPAFLAYVGRRPSPKHSIDRWPDTNGNYEPGNVRWATSKEQNLNRQYNVWIKYNGERRKLAEVCEELGRDPVPLLLRRRRGWKDEDLFKPTDGSFRSSDTQRNWQHGYSSRKPAPQQNVNEDHV